MTSRRLSPCPHSALLAAVARYLGSRRAVGYLVGGAVRDALLDRPSADIDIVVKGVRPVEVAGYLSREHGFTRPVVFKRADTAFTRGALVQVEVCRLEGSPAEDALRRDFTVNCLYVKLTSGLRRMKCSSVLDPTGSGLRDLRERRLRAHPDPFTSLAGDPLRLMRAVRLEAVLGFSIDGALKDAMRRIAYLISGSAAERVREELAGVLVSRRVRSAFRLMLETGLLEMLLPEVAVTAGLEQGSPHHAYDLLTHTLRATAGVRPSLDLRLAALLHDIGKVRTRRRKGGRFVYYGHEKVSAAMARSVLARLRFPARVSADVTFLIENHMVNYTESWTDAAVRRFMRRMGDRLDDVLHLAEADRRAHAPGAWTGSPVGELRERIAAVRSRMDSRGMSFESPLDGRRIMEILGIGPGPEVGRAKEHLCGVVLRRGAPLSEGEAARVLLEWARDAEGSGSEPPEL